MQVIAKEFRGSGQACSIEPKQELARIQRTLPEIRALFTHGDDRR